MTQKARIALGGIVHETHSFSDIPTILADFKQRSLFSGDAILQEMSGTRAGIGGMIEGAQHYDWELIPTLYGTAMPAGIVSEQAYQTMRGELLERLTESMPVDGVLLALHGAMVTEESLDAESDILEAVRGIVGEDVPIVVELDMHGNISPRTAELADVLVAFDTNPHIDPHVRGVETTHILADILDNKITPTAAHVSVPLILAPQFTGTADLPLSAVHDRVQEMESEDEVICICVMAGFAYADMPFTGASIIVTTNNQPDLAQQYAQELNDILLKNHQTDLNIYSPDEAVKKALASDDHPIILVDSADNIGGGTPGDGADALKAMLDNDVPEGAVVLADAEAVETCWTTGVGGEVSLAVGGKSDRWHGEPVTVTGVVQAISDGIFECELADNHFAAFYGNTIHMGRTVWLRVGGVNIILTTHKTPPFDLGQLRHIGVIPEVQKMIAVKSAVAYQAAYLPIARGVIEMDTAGLCSMNLSRFPYEHVDTSRLSS